MLLCCSLRSAFYVCLSMSCIWKKASSSFLRCVHFSDFWHIWSDVHSLCEYSTTFQKRSAVNCANYSYFDMNDFKMPSFMVYCYEKKTGNTSALCRVFPIFLYNSHFISAKNSRSILFGRYFGVESAAIPQTSESPYFLAICRARNT